MARRYWIDVAIAPLRWVERARGWRRVALLAVYALIAAVAGLLIGREATLWRIPDLPDPVPPVAGRPPAARSDDPMTAEFRRAAARLDRDHDPRHQDGLTVHERSVWAWTYPDPSRLRPWLEANRPALDLWQAATRRPLPPPIGAESREVPNRPEAPDSLFDDLLRLSKLAVLDAQLRQDAGDSLGAWERYLGVLRTAVRIDRQSLWTVHGGWVGMFESRWSPVVRTWAERPEVDPVALRRALVDLTAVMALRPTEADLIRNQYCLLRNQLNDAEFLSHARSEWVDNAETVSHLPGVAEAIAFWQNEPKRSLRVLRAVTAGQLARAEQPEGQRPNPVPPEAYGIFALDAVTPPALARSRPEALVGWVEASYARFLSFAPPFRWATLVSWDRLDRTRWRIASRLYEIDHPGQSATTLGDLVPQYLDALPPGTKASDPL